MSTHEHDRSEQPAVGTGVSSERVGPTGRGAVGTDGLRDTSSADPEDTAEDAAPEQSPGGVEPHPDAPGPPVSGYNSKDPRHDEAPYDAAPDVGHGR